MLVTDVINGALRKLGVLASGREPRLSERNDALAALQGLYRQWINSGAFGRLEDVTPTVDYTVRGGQRVYRDQSGVVNITLPDVVDVCDWGPLTPLDCAVVVIIDAFAGLTVDYIYDGHTKRWQAIHGLTLTDEAPLSFRDPQGLQACLAFQMADEFGQQIGSATVRQARVFQNALVNRFSMPETIVPGIYV